MNGRSLRWLLSLVRPLRSDGAHECRVTIVRHHRVYADGERPLYRLGVSESVLRAQLELLAAHGLAPVTLAEGASHVKEGRPGHRIALSFDDGYADNVARALPLVEASGARATFFLTAGLMEDGSAPWWDVLAHALDTTTRTELVWSPEGRPERWPLEGRDHRRRVLRRLLPALRVQPELRTARLEALRAALGVVAPAPAELADWRLAARLPEAGMEVGAHTLTHPHLSLLEPEAQRQEIVGSVALIERHLGVSPRGFAYPGGDYDARTVEIVSGAGFDYAVTTRAGDNRPGASAFELKRRGFSEGTCLGPGGRFSRRLALAELDGAFDAWRGVNAQVAS